MSEYQLGRVHGTSRGSEAVRPVRPKRRRFRPIRILFEMLLLVGLFYSAVHVLIVPLSSILNERFHESATQGRHRAVTPKLWGMEFRALPFASEDGTRLSSWVFRPADREIRDWIVVLPGSGMCKAGSLGRGTAELFTRAGFGVMLLDPRGQGRSGGLASYGYRERNDIDAAYRVLTSDEGARRVALFGYSSGGAAAIMAAARNTNIAAVVSYGSYARIDGGLIERWSETLADGLGLDKRLPLVPPETSLPRVLVSSQLALWGFKYFYPRIDTTAVSPLTEVGMIPPRSVLILHNSDDQLVPVQAAEELVAAARAGATQRGQSASRVTHRLLPGTHRIVLVGDIYQEWSRSVLSFLGRVMPRSTATSSPEVE